MKEIEVAGGQFLNTADIPLQNPGDFIVSMVPDEKHGFLFALSQAGFLFLFDLVSGLCVFDRQISQVNNSCQKLSFSHSNFLHLGKGKRFWAVILSTLGQSPFCFGFRNF